MLRVLKYFAIATAILINNGMASPQNPQGLIFLHVPKAGGVTVFNKLVSGCDVRKITKGIYSETNDLESLLAKFPYIDTHLPLKRIVETNKTHKPIFTFSREPKARFISDLRFEKTCTLNSPVPRKNPCHK